MAEFVLDPGYHANLQRVMAAAQAKIVAEIADDARRFVPVDTGELKSTIRIQGNQVWVGSDHWHYVEYGTRAHVIEPNEKQALYWPGARHPVARVNHPGTPAQPYMRAALYRSR